MACCVPYQLRYGPGPAAHLWWASPSEWVYDILGVSTGRQACTAVVRALRSMCQHMDAFLRIYKQNPALFSFYLLLGASGTFPMVTMQFLLKDTFELQPETMKLWGTCVVLPWSVKLLFAFTSDRWAIFGYHRRVYILAGSFIGALGWFMAALNVIRRSGDHHPLIHDNRLELGSFAFFTLSMVLVNFGIAWADACTNAALMDYITTTRDAPGVQSVKSATQSAGSLAGVLAGSYAVAFLPPQVVMFVMAAFAWCMFCVGLAIPETPELNRNQRMMLAIMADAQTERGEDPVPVQRVPDEKPLKEHLRDVWRLLKDPKVFHVLFFLALVTLPPDSGTAMFYFLTERLDFSRSFIAVVSIATAVCSIVGSFLYFSHLQDVSFRVLFLGVFFVCAPLGYLQIMLVTRTNVALGIPDRVFVLGDDVVQAITVSIINTPILVIISRACPNNLKGTAYELVNSVANGCAILSSFGSTWLMDALSISRTNFGNLVFLLLITNTANLVVPLPGVLCLPSGSSSKPAGPTAPSPQGPSALQTRMMDAILMVAAYAQPPHALYASVQRRQWYTKQPRVALNANGMPPTTRNWGVAHGLRAFRGLERSTRPHGRVRMVKLQPRMEGEVVAVDSRSLTDMRFAAATTTSARSLNAIRSALATDAMITRQREQAKKTSVRRGGKTYQSV